MNRITAMYKLEILSSEVREKNKLRPAIYRRDCTLSSGDYKGIEPFMNKKGMFFLSLAEQKDFVSSHIKRQAEFSLVGQNLNFSGLYFEDPENPQFAFGYPFQKPHFKNEAINPAFEYRNDLYLFITDSHYLTFEILIFKGARNLASDYFQMLINGDFDNEIEDHRINYKKFYPYD
ncbi:MAG: hypothetical protein ACK5UE_14965 [Chitinophagales bacterium]|jgi:hypothetical protein|nr:hypothetical protein [Sphingobacteriales bacterium]